LIGRRVIVAQDIPTPEIHDHITCIPPNRLEKPGTPAKAKAYQSVNTPLGRPADLPFGGIKNPATVASSPSMGIQESVNKKLVAAFLRSTRRPER